MNDKLKSKYSSFSSRVPPGKVLSLNLSHVTLSCPELVLNLRDGVLEQDPLLYQSGSGSPPVPGLVSSLNLVRVELLTSDLDRNLLVCYANLNVHIKIIG